MNTRHIRGVQASGRLRVTLSTVETILQKREASIMRSAGDRGAASRLAHGVEAA
jgi:hypothetical protein